MAAKDHFINDTWVDGSGPRMSSADPASGETIWEGRAAAAPEVNQAVEAARAAFASWSATSRQQRASFLTAFRSKLEERREYLALTISQDTGKPRWEARTEIDAMVAKIGVSIEIYEERCAPVVHEESGIEAAVRFKPHGVVAVLGPFNLPGHLPNAHIVPALIAGNTVVFKPSERTPLAGRELVEIWQTAGLPRGVINMVQGGPETGKFLIGHPDVDGVFFTGGYETGKAIHRQLAGTPEKIVALEMGGNNPLAVYDVRDPDAAAYWTIYSAFLTAGQRCTCARRLIVPESEEGDAFLQRVLTLVKHLRVGAYDSELEPFMGPVISSQTSERLLLAQATMQRQGAESIHAMTLLHEPSMLSPGLIDVTKVENRPDVEFFGPLLQIIRVRSFEELIEEANNTAYGLAAGIFTDHREIYERFYREVRAGIVNWNRPLTGAGGKLPFGGIGRSGNHRPSGSYAVQYCSYPTASLEQGALKMPEFVAPGIVL